MWEMRPGGEGGFMGHEQLVATWITFMSTAIRKARGLTRDQFLTLAFDFFSRR
jgi:hypothetical protein